MTTFAELDKDGAVLRVIVIDEHILATGAWGDPSLWVETKMDNYAGIGDKFDNAKRSFVNGKKDEGNKMTEPEGTGDAL